MAVYAFEEKLAEAEDSELRRILESVYRSFFPPGSVEEIEYDDSEEFQSSGRDVRVTLRATRGKHFVQTIEEKIRSPNQSHFSDLCIEYLSNVQRGTLGCVCTSKADWLAYIRQPRGRVIVTILPMQLFKRWFMTRANEYPDLPAEPGTTLSNGSYYSSRCKLIEWADESFTAFRNANGCFVRVVEKQMSFGW